MVTLTEVIFTFESYGINLKKLKLNQRKINLSLKFTKRMSLKHEKIKNK